MQTVGVVVIFLGGQADEVVVGVAVLFEHKVGVVGGYNLDIVLAGQLNEHRFHFLLEPIGVVVGIGLVGLVAHQFDVVVVAKHLFEPQHRTFGPLQVAPQDKLRYLAAQTGRADDKTLMVLLQHLMVNARTVIETLRIGNGCQLAQRMVALQILGQQNEVVAAAVHNAVTARLRVNLLQVLVLVVQAAAGTVGLGAHDGLKGRFPFGSALVHLVDGIKKILDAEHIAVVRQGQGIHTVAAGLVDKVGYLRHSVEHRIVRMYMQVSELGHSVGIYLLEILFVTGVDSLAEVGEPIGNIAAAVADMVTEDSEAVLLNATLLGGDRLDGVLKDTHRGIDGQVL